MNDHEFEVGDIVTMSERAYPLLSLWASYVKGGLYVVIEKFNDSGELRLRTEDLKTGVQNGWGLDKFIFICKKNELTRLERALWGLTL